MTLLFEEKGLTKEKYADNSHPLYLYLQGNIQNRSEVILNHPDIIEFVYMNKDIVMKAFLVKKMINFEAGDVPSLQICCDLFDTNQEQSVFAERTNEVSLQVVEERKGNGNFFVGYFYITLYNFAHGIEVSDSIPVTESLKEIEETIENMDSVSNGSVKVKKLLHRDINSPKFSIQFVPSLMTGRSDANLRQPRIQVRSYLPNTNTRQSYLNIKNNFIRREIQTIEMHKNASIISCHNGNENGVFLLTKIVQVRR